MADLFGEPGGGKAAERNARKKQLLEWFEKIFWPEYPRRDKKDAAIRAWLKISPARAEVQAIVTDIRNRLRGRHSETNWNGVEKQYIPLPSSYLNGGYWKR